MFKIISAKEARGLRVKDRLTMEAIMETIHKEAPRWSFHTFHNSTMDKDLEQYLVALGYEVKRENASSIRIVWGDNDER